MLITINLGGMIWSEKYQIGPDCFFKKLNFCWMIFWPFSKWIRLLSRTLYTELKVLFGVITYHKLFIIIQMTNLKWMTWSEQCQIEQDQYRKSWNFSEFLYATIFSNHLYLKDSSPRTEDKVSLVALTWYYDIKALCYDVNNYQPRMNDVVREISNRTRLLLKKLNFCWMTFWHFSKWIRLLSRTVCTELKVLYGVLLFKL